MLFGITGSILIAIGTGFYVIRGQIGARSRERSAVDRANQVLLQWKLPEIAEWKHWHYSSQGMAGTFFGMMQMKPGFPRSGTRPRFP